MSGESFVTPEMLQTFTAMTEGAMPDSAFLHIPGGWVDEGGGSGYREAGTTVAFPCRVVAMSTKEDLREFYSAGKMDVSNIVSMYCPLPNSQITPDSIITVTSGRHSVSTTYEVAGLPPLSSYAVHRQVLLRRIGSG